MAFRFKNETFSVLAAALFCAFVSFIYFNFYPFLMTEGGESPIGLLGVDILTVLLILMPFLMIAAIMRPQKEIILVARIHAGIFLTLLLLTSFAGGSSGHSSPGAGIGKAIMLILYSIIGIEFFLIFLIGHFSKQKNMRIISLLIPAVVIGGWGFGVLFWSLKYVPYVIKQAELAGFEKDYCLLAAGKPVLSLAGLMPLNMYASDRNGYTWNFHGLMILGEDNDRHYMNWSFREGKFNLINEQTQKRMHLDKGRQCKPMPHFAKNLPLIKM